MNIALCRLFAVGRIVARSSLLGSVARRNYFAQAVSTEGLVEQLKKIVKPTPIPAPIQALKAAVAAAIPTPIEKPADMFEKYPEILDKTKQILRKRGFSDLTVIQKQLLAPIMKGEQVFAKDITGSGKTLAYIIPILEALRRDKMLPRSLRKERAGGPYALVIVPTRELALQVCREGTNQMDRRNKSSRR